MQNNTYVITGKRDVGKTTSLNAIIGELSALHYELKGFRTFFVDKKLILQWENIEKPLIELGHKTAKKSLKPHFDELDRVGTILKEQRFSDCVFFADEIGFLESLSKNMQEGILKAITAADFSIISMRYGDYPFLKKIKELNTSKVYVLESFDLINIEKIKREIIKGIRG